MSSSLAEVASAGRKLLPILEWIPAYRRKWLLPDVLAGVALWAVMVPEGMAYASIVGVPPIMGLYTIVPALLAYGRLPDSEAYRDVQRHPEAVTFSGLLICGSVVTFSSRASITWGRD
jgi:hypothetical protein